MKARQQSQNLLDEDGQEQFAVNDSDGDEGFPQIKH